MFASFDCHPRRSAARFRDVAEIAAWDFFEENIFRRSSFSILEGFRTLCVALPRILGVKCQVPTAMINKEAHNFDPLINDTTSTRTIAYKTMRHCLTCTAMAALALLATCYRVVAFVPPSVSMTRVAVHPTLEQFAKPFDSIESDDIETKMENMKQIHIQDGMEDSLEQTKHYNPTPVLFNAFQNFFDQKRSFAAVAALALTLFMTPLPSFAAMSGGRMGGSFSAPRSSYGSASPSRSYGGGRGYYGGSSYNSGFASGYTRGLGSGYYSRGPTVLVNPITPMISPFYSPFGYGGGPGIVTYSSGPSILPLLLFGGLAFAAISSMTSTLTTSSSWADSSPLSSGAFTSALGPGASVAQVSVALEVPDRDDRNSILSVLGRLANTARTDTRVGIQNLTSQVALELLRRKSSIVSASTSYKHYSNRDQALRDFNKRSIQERSKFESETISNFGGLDFGSGGRGATEGSGKATMAVVTLLINIDGDSTKLPQIRSSSDVEEALRKIAADSKVESCLQGAEILWTPEDRIETLSPRDVASDYPELRSI
jgi:uncharacterized membrane protein